MKKLDSLKSHLLATIKKLSPTQIHVFADDGTIACSLNGNLNFSYKYKATIIIEDLSISPDNVFVPLLIWCQHNQVDMQQEDIRFIAEPLDNKKVDLRIELPLDERVMVTLKENGNYTTTHPSEPVPEYNLPIPNSFTEIEAQKETSTHE